MVSARRRALLSWYDRHRRDLPWRRNLSLYGTWIAEIMLQQTTVATVAGRWEEFLRRFPDARALAAAEQSEVLAAWTGLGYYRRARLLHAAARRLVAENDGRLPRDLAGWRSLPGVGEYAAAAIVSVGLGLPAAAIDVNIRRVLTRWHCASRSEADILRPRDLRELAEEHLCRERPGDWNQALMDLGAGICRAGAADCPRCPVRRRCAAGLAGTADAVPRPPAVRTARQVLLSVLVLRLDDRLLWLPSEQAMAVEVAGLGPPRRTALAGLLAGLWSLPMTCWYAGQAAPTFGIFQAAWRRWLINLGWPDPVVDEAGRHRHAITDHRLVVLVATAAWPRGLAVPEVGGGWWGRVDQAPPLSSLTQLSLKVVPARVLLA